MDEKIKLALKQGYMLPLMEAFYTIQGEGYFSGKPAFFLRIGGCDVGCHWCDVKDSWDANLHPPTYIDVIVSKVLENSSDTIVITGGEPLMWNLSHLTSLLRLNNKKIHLETSGSYKLSGKFDWICLSPKKMEEPLIEIAEVANELKIIIFNKHDFIWAEKQRKKVKASCELYLQPEWSKRDIITPMIVDYVKNNSHWSISLQTHKFINIP
jgi:organic radical activating enzyme